MKVGGSGKGEGDEEMKEGFGVFMSRHKIDVAQNPHLSRFAFFTFGVVVLKG